MYPEETSWIDEKSELNFNENVRIENLHTDTLQTC